MNSSPTRPVSRPGIGRRHRSIILGLSLASLLLPACSQTNPKIEAGSPGPDLPPAGSGTEGPIAIRLIAPTRPIHVPASSFEVARQAGRAEHQIRTLKAQRREQGQAPWLGGLNDEERRTLKPVVRKGMELRQGVHLILRLTNVSRETVTVHVGPDTSEATLRVEGPGAIFLAYDGAVTADLRLPPATVLKPGQSKDFPIRELRSGGRELDRWVIAAPGTYTARLRFTTHLPKDPGPGKRPPIPDFSNGTEIDLTSNEVSFEVRSAGP